MTNDICEDFPEELNYKDIKPSQEDKDFWLYCSNRNNEYPKHTFNCGKWMIFAPQGEVLDSIWEEIKELMRFGLLGKHSKCSTAKENPNSLNKKYGVICIYTYNSNDKEDLKRIAEQLFSINRVNKLLYKEDNTTYEQKYVIKGNKNISKYSATKDNFEEILR